MNNENEHIDDSKLRSIRTSGGFTHPDDYFEQSRSSILAQVLASKSNPAQVDDAYFKHTRHQIILKTIGTDSDHKPVIIWHRRPLFRYPAAAILLLSISTGLWFNLNSGNKLSSTANLSDEEILQYLQQTDLRDLPMTEVSFTLIDNKTTTEEENYIINQTDEQTLLEEL